MDNFDQAEFSSNRSEKIDDELPVKLEERNEFGVAEKFSVSKKKFDFGGNILNTKTMSTSSSSHVLTTNTGEEADKTNNEIIKTNGNVVLEETIIQDIPINDGNVDPLNPGQVECNNYGDNEEEDEEGQSFQTDNENSQLSQYSAKFLQTSKEHEDDDEDNPTDETADSASSSDLSGLSDMSGKEWKPINLRLNWVQQQIHSGANPREIISICLPSSGECISRHLSDMYLWRILASILSEFPRRNKLSYVNTFEDVIDLVRKSKNIIVLTGAGVSVSCGIPDFRSSDGIYSRLAKDFPDFRDPQAMFDINYFSRDPRPFYKFAREIYPGQFKPSPCHNFIKMLEQKQKLLRNYTQNIDTLEQVAGIKNVIECHGSFSTASCTKCRYKCNADSIRDDIFAQRIPVCPRCQPNVKQSLDASEPVSENDLRQLVENGIMKPDIVFFGEGLPKEFHTVMASDKDKCDLLIVMGSSLKVRPVALIPSSIPNHVPQILINREQLHHLEFDVELLGDGDVIINQICQRLGEEWKDICFNDEVLKESKELITIVEDVEEENSAKELSGDTDILSIKSNQSSELVLQTSTTTTTTYSDSCFETSSTCSKKEFISPDDFDEPMDTTSFGGSCDYRHLSIDSSKDSGILGDSSNSASAPHFSNFVDSSAIKNSLNMPASTTQAISNKSVVNDLQNTKISDSNCSEAEKQNLRRQLKHQSIAERLLKGTYYIHGNTSSYVFPGAQVSWASDSEEEKSNNCNEDDTNQAPLSPLMTPSVENEMVKAIASTTVGSHQSSSGAISSNNTDSSNSSILQNNVSPQQQQTQKKGNLIETSAECSYDFPRSFVTEAKYNSGDVSYSDCPPPHKKRRDSTECIIPSNISLEFT